MGKRDAKGAGLCGERGTGVTGMCGERRGLGGLVWGEGGTEGVDVGRGIWGHCCVWGVGGVGSLVYGERCSGGMSV